MYFVWIVIMVVPKTAQDEQQRNRRKLKLETAYHIKTIDFSKIYRLCNNLNVHCNTLIVSFQDRTLSLIVF